MLLQRSLAALQIVRNRISQAVDNPQIAQICSCRAINAFIQI
jgi:hypothetical protein